MHIYKFQIVEIKFFVLINFTFFLILIVACVQVGGAVCSPRHGGARQGLRRPHVPRCPGETQDCAGEAVCGGGASA